MRSPKFRITAAQITGVILLISCLVDYFRSVNISEAGWHQKTLKEKKKLGAQTWIMLFCKQKNFDHVSILRTIACLQCPVVSDVVQLLQFYVSIFFYQNEASCKH